MYTCLILKTNQLTNPQKVLTKAAIYARVSTKDKGQEAENQLAQLRTFASEAGWAVVHEYIDCASGKSSNRDQFREMLTAASRRKFNVVLVWALDRFTREGVAETFIHIRRLLENGVQFVSFTEEHFRTTGPAGELMIAIAAWIAKQERIRLSERTKAGLERARRAGRVGGRPRTVCDYDELVRLRSDGMSLRKISKATGVSHTSVARILRDPS